MQQLPLAIATRHEPTFDGFVVGDNALAVAQLRALAPAAASLPAGAAPCYLWGPSGSGKTHLLRALAAQWRRHGGAVAAFDADAPLPWTAPPVAAPAGLLIVLDGCDAFDAERQHAAFALFVDAAVRPRCGIAAAGRLPPVDLPLRDDLRSRLGWGHVLALHPLPDDAVRRALRAIAHDRGLRLPDEVLDHLLTRSARDLKHMVAQLDRLDDLALASRRAITLPLLRELQAGEAAATASAQGAPR